MNEDETILLLGADDGRGEGGLLALGEPMIGGEGEGDAVVIDGSRQQAISASPTNKQLVCVRKIFIVAVRFNQLSHSNR